MKARIIDQPVTVYSGTDPGAMPVTQASVGTIVDLGSAKRKGSWVTIVLADGRRGYISGGARVAFLKRATLVQNDVSAYSEPSTSSAVAARYSKAATLPRRESQPGRQSVGQSVRLRGNRRLH